MHRQVIRSSPPWRRSYRRYNTAFIQVSAEADVMSGMQVRCARIKLMTKLIYSM
jgi:hypothetical protein